MRPRVERATDDSSGLSEPGELVSDDELVQRTLEGDLGAFELIMSRYNQRIFRVVRSIVVDDDEAQDVVQDAYVSAFEYLKQFAGRAKFSTWLTKIAVYEALARRQRRKPIRYVDLSDPKNASMEPYEDTGQAERNASSKELAALLARAIDELPDELRTVFTMRVVEETSTEETAASLNLTEANVKVRLHRARALLRQRIDKQVGESIRRVYQFDGARCDSIVRAVTARVGSLVNKTGSMRSQEQRSKDQGERK